PILIGIIFLLVRKHIRKKSIVVGIFSSILIASFFVQADIVDKNRSFWFSGWGGWQDVVNNMYYQKPSTIFLVYTSNSNGGTKLWSWSYSLWGDNMQHEVKGITDNELFTFLKNNDQKSYPDYLVELCNPNDSCMNDFNDFASKVKEYNYEVKIIKDKAILLKHG
ncbi:MAG: hypothetical protein KGL95_02825, partial [Patescibacteria group bacterium]|nr:hypothetical protein [Patescibacteria group bacterium]